MFSLTWNSLFSNSSSENLKAIELKIWVHWIIMFFFQLMEDVEVKGDKSFNLLAFPKQSPFLRFLFSFILMNIYGEMKFSCYWTSKSERRSFCVFYIEIQDIETFQWWKEYLDSMFFKWFLKPFVSPIRLPIRCQLATGKQTEYIS